MASRYHWLTPGIDTNFALGQPTAQCFAASIPAGGIVKRFQLRNCLFHAKNFSNTFTNVFGLSIDMTVQFTSGPNNGRIIYKGKRDIPLQYGINVGSISGVYTGIWHAGDNELGFNQRCSYGLATGAAANLQFSYFMVPDPFHGYDNYFGEWSFQFGVLYYQ